MYNEFLTNYTETTVLDKIKENLRRCTAVSFSVSFIKRAGLVLLYKDIEAAVERGANGKIITSTYQNFTDIESLRSFLALQNRCENFECHLDYECFHDSGYAVLGYHSKGYISVAFGLFEQRRGNKFVAFYERKNQGQKDCFLL